MAAAVPLNITLSIGDVRFHLAPSPSTNYTPPSPQTKQNSPYAAHRKGQPLRRGGSLRGVRGTSFSQYHPNAITSSPPIVAIRHGAPQAVSSNNPSPSPISHDNINSHQSPLRQHILGRVRSMKDVYESSQDGRHQSAPQPHQSFSPRDGSAPLGEYCVDLNSFSGTLHITSLMKNDHAEPIAMRDTSQAHSLPEAMLGSPRKRTASSDYATDAAMLSEKRSRVSSVWSPSGESEEEIYWNGDNGAEVGYSSSDQSTNQTKKSVRFSMASLARDSSLFLGDIESQQSRSLQPATTRQLKPQSNIIDASQTTVAQSPQQQTMQQHQKQKNNVFFSSPPRTTTIFSSPPRGARATARASINIARETTSVLARSSKHVLRQITLAGKDAYDALNGDALLSSSPTNNRADSNTTRTQDFISSHDSSNDDNDVYNALDGTELHYACASDSLANVRCLLESDSLVDITQADCDGKLPINVFTENHELIRQHPLECEEVVFTMIQVMGPDKALQALHPGGLAPFVYTIGAWTEQLHRAAIARSKNVVTTRSSTSTKRPAESTTTQLDENHQRSVEPVPPSSVSQNASSRRRRVTYRSLFHSSTVKDKSLTSSVDRAKLLWIPPDVTISDHVRWAIRILSRLIDEYPEQKIRESILTNIACVPLFLKSLLLINDAEEVAELLDTSLVKHVIVDKRSINVWLCAMLTNTKEVKKRAVTFIKLLSRLTLHDLAATSHCPDRYSDREIERFATHREETFNAVYEMPGIVPAVLELGGKMIENMSTTRVMRYITDRTIRKESVFFVLICDFFYSIFLLMGFRLNVEFVLNYQSVDGPENYRQQGYISTLTLGIAFYFLVKEAITLLSLYLTSKKLAKRYCLSVFNIIDVASVAMLLGTESALTYDPNLNENSPHGFAASLTIILLWLKLMGAFKILNGAFALFLHAVHEVVMEIKWFLMFLVAVTLMFSDAARTVVAARGDCQHDNMEGDYIVNEFCSDNLLAVPIRMYSVLAGDVALEYFQSSDAMVAVFIFFTFFSIIVLLNILVAIILDSYEKSKQRSREIFYRARIEYAAHLVARKQFLNPKESTDFHVATYIPKKARQALMIFYRLVSAAAALAAEYGFVGAINFLFLDAKYEYRMIHSLVIVYVSVGAIFNLYVFSVGVIALYSIYNKRFNGLVWPADNQHTTMHSFVKKAIWFFEMAVNLLHRLLGFNADRSDISEEYLVTGEDII